jgi:DNA replication initiation complex subunit (GINS family)
MEVLTYEALREIQRNEKKSEKLFELSNDFYKAFEAYIEQRTNSKDESSTIEVQNAKNILRDIVDRREKKILNQALRTARTQEKVDKGTMTEKEQELYDALLNVLNEYRFDLNGNGQKPAEEEEEDEEEPKEEDSSRIKIKVLEDLPAIVGADFEDYGPFKAGEVIELPRENAEIFLNKEKAEKAE